MEFPLAASMRKWPGCVAWQEMHGPGPLRPEFVEWMMGFPEGYTVPPDTEPTEE